MQIVNDIKPVTYLKSRATDVLNYINKTHRPMIITQNGEAKAVIQDPELWREDIRNKNLHTQEDVFSSVEELLNKWVKFIKFNGLQKIV